MAGGFKTAVVIVVWLQCIFDYKVRETVPVIANDYRVREAVPVILMITGFIKRFHVS